MKSENVPKIQKTLVTSSQTVPKSRLKIMSLFFFAGLGVAHLRNVWTLRKNLKESNQKTGERINQIIAKYDNKI